MASELGKRRTAKPYSATIAEYRLYWEPLPRFASEMGRQKGRLKDYWTGAGSEPQRIV